MKKMEANHCILKIHKVPNPKQSQKEEEEKCRNQNRKSNPKREEGSFVRSFEFHGESEAHASFSQIRYVWNLITSLIFFSLLKKCNPHFLRHAKFAGKKKAPRASTSTQPSLSSSQSVTHSVSIFLSVFWFAKSLIWPLFSEFESVKPATRERSRRVRLFAKSLILSLFVLWL